MTNKVYPKLKKHIQENGGYSMDSLKENGIYREHTEYMDYLKSLDEKKVKIKYVAQVDLSTSEGEKKGRIRFINNELMFFEGRCTRKYYNLTAGLDEGHYATLVVKDVEIIN